VGGLNQPFGRSNLRPGGRGAPERRAQPGQKEPEYQASHEQEREQSHEAKPHGTLLGFSATMAEFARRRQNRCSMSRLDLYGCDLPQLGQLLEPLSVEPYRAKQIYRQLYQRGSLAIGEWTELPQRLRSELEERFCVDPPRISQRVQAQDGTVKFTLELPRGGEVEAVAIPFGSRVTFCISSQIGCAFGCAFCMTAKLGFVRHLTAGEIVGQVEALLRATDAERGRHNIVFMGMGEPLHNVDNVLRAIALLTDPQGFGLGPRRLTVSTVGLIAGIDRLAAAPVVPRLAISLVAAEQQLRAVLMPVAKSVSLPELAEAVRRFGAGKRDQPTFEVVMLDRVNDAPELAQKLADLARTAGAKVNLIEFNPTPHLPYQPSPEARVEQFLHVLTSRGITATVRRSRGKDAFAACGQLAFLQRLGPGEVQARHPLKANRSSP
jgi:23S rRNA (adenine2503-C2)-methyltransferase